MLPALKGPALLDCSPHSAPLRPTTRIQCNPTTSCPRRSSTASISFGKCEVLTEHSRQLLLHNPTLIPAAFKLFVEGRDSSFSVEPRELRLEPGGSAEATVRAVLDETQTFKDELHVLIEEGADVPIPLEATGERQGRRAFRNPRQGDRRMGYLFMRGCWVEEV